MDSKRLKYFLVVCELESIRRAAEVLNITPAALSKAIKQLEFETGTTLLMPVGRGIAITESGLTLASRAKPLIEDLEKLRQDFKSKKNTPIVINKPIRIGSFESFTTHFLRKLIQSFNSSLELVLREVIPGEIEKSLLKREIDYGITFIPIPTAGIHYKQITFFEMKIYGRSNIYNKMAFSKLPFVVPILPLLKSANKIKELDGWPDDQRERLIKYRVDLMESGLELCRQGKAVAYLPTFVVNLHNETVKQAYNLEPIPFPLGMLPQKQAVYIVKRKSDPDDQILIKIADIINNVCI